jgi:hypothetical protein
MRLRYSADLNRLSTLEAVATAVGALEGEQHAQCLRALHDEMVRRVLIGRGRVLDPP